jgi:hypothetical protein
LTLLNHLAELLARRTNHAAAQAPRIANTVTNSPNPKFPSDQSPVKTNERFSFAGQDAIALFSCMNRPPIGVLHRLVRFRFPERNHFMSDLSFDTHSTAVVDDFTRAVMPPMKRKESVNVDVFVVDRTGSSSAFAEGIRRAIPMIAKPVLAKPARVRLFLQTHGDLDHG